MRILLAAKTMGVGGLERIVVGLARELQERGHRVWVVSSGGDLVADLIRTGADHVEAPLDITSPLGVAQAARRIRRLIVDQHIDLVHSFSATASVAINLALRVRSSGHNGLGSVRVVSSPMGLQNSPRELAVTTWLRNWFLTLGAEQILVISPEIRRHLKRVGAREESLVDFNFVGLDLQAFVPAQAQPGVDDHQSVRREFGFPSDALLVSTIGALHPRKSHELFIEAAALISAAEPAACFLIIGEGELRAELESLSRSRGLEGKLAFTGVRDDISRLLAATDVYVKPGVVEGFIGITVLEALALAKPVVAFDTEDVKLALTDGQTGLIVPIGDVPQLADQVVRLLRNPAVGAALGEAGQQVVMERFDFGVLARRLEGFYQGVLGRPVAIAP